MIPTRVAKRFIRITTLSLSSMGIVGCLYYTRLSPQEVRDAVQGAGVLGATPTEVQDKLRRIQLAGGRKLLVGRYDPDRQIIGSRIPAAARTFMTRWSIQLVVKFDSTGRAHSIEAYNSADNPL